MPSLSDQADIASSHVTPPDGNVFADIGFEAEEAQELLRAADTDLYAKVRTRLSEKSKAVAVDIEEL